jgi:hypothetical protein
MKNKFTLLAIAAVLILAVQSCDKIVADNLKFDLSMQTGSVDITIPPISDTTSNVTLGTVISSYNFDSAIKAGTSNKLGVSNIGSAKMVSCKLTLLNHNDSNNFANFQNTNVNFFTNSNTTPFVAATVTNNPDVYADTLNVPVDATTELKSYLTGTQLTYSLMGKMRRKTTDTIVCRVQLTMNVQVHS